MYRTTKIAGLRGDRDAMERELTAWVVMRGPVVPGFLDSRLLFAEDGRAVVSTARFASRQDYEQLADARSLMRWVHRGPGFTEALGSLRRSGSAEAGTRLAVPPPPGARPMEQGAQDPVSRSGRRPGFRRRLRIGSTTCRPSSGGCAAGWDRGATRERDGP